MSFEAHSLLGRILPRIGKPGKKRMKRTARWRRFGRRLAAEMLEDRRMLAGDLFINEIMADNDAIIEDPDEAGAFEDWVEVYINGVYYGLYTAVEKLTTRLSRKAGLERTKTAICTRDCVG